MFSWLRNLHQQAPAQTHEPTEASWTAIESTLPFIGHLSRPERSHLRTLALKFAQSKQWVGTDGLVLTQEIQLSIALQACLLVLHLGLDRYRGWTGIVVHPGDFVIPRSIVDETGVVHEFDDTVLGEAWENGPVLLSWFPPDETPKGINIVIHEFAHKLDMENGGVADGIPRLNESMSQREWQRKFQSAYEDFCRQCNTEFPENIDIYAADSPAEFFAVLSEAFFLTPKHVQNRYPEIHSLLKKLYRQAPCAVS